MSKNSRRPQRIYGAVMWLISFIFAACLIGLGSLVIRDLPQVETEYALADFVDQEAMSVLELEREEMTQNLVDLRRDLEDKNAYIHTTFSGLRAAEASFEAWLANRTVTEASDQNPEVALRTRVLEAKRHEVSDAEVDRDEIERQIREQENEITDVGVAMADLRAEAWPAFNAHENAVQTRVFLYRLALTLPLLIISVFLVVKYRKSSYWPLYRGFVLFSAFAFFVELVPYLPSYGGYVRYGVGVIVAAVAGHFTILGMKKYLAKQREAEARSEPERRKAIPNELALKKLESGICPGCDRSVNPSLTDGSDFCAHCGMRLKADCGSCHTHKLVFYAFCKECGHDCAHDFDEEVEVNPPVSGGGGSPLPEPVPG